MGVGWRRRQHPGTPTTTTTCSHIGAGPEPDHEPSEFPSITNLSSKTSGSSGTWSSTRARPPLASSGATSVRRLGSSHHRQTPDVTSHMGRTGAAPLRRDTVRRVHTGSGGGRVATDVNARRLRVLGKGPNAPGVGQDLQRSAHRYRRGRNKTRDRDRGTQDASATNSATPPKRPEEAYGASPTESGGAEWYLF